MLYGIWAMFWFFTLYPLPFYLCLCLNYIQNPTSAVSRLLKNMSPPWGSLFNGNPLTQCSRTGLLTFHPYGVLGLAMFLQTGVTAPAINISPLWGFWVCWIFLNRGNAPVYKYIAPTGREQSNVF